MKKEFIKILEEEMIICKEFRDYEEEWSHIKPFTTELERFIGWFKRFKLPKLIGEDLK